MNPLQKDVWNSYVDFRREHECRIRNLAINTTAQSVDEGQALWRLANFYILVKSYAFVESALLKYASSRGWQVDGLADCVQLLQSDEQYRHFVDDIRGRRETDPDYKNYIPDNRVDFYHNLERMRRHRNRFIHDWKSDTPDDIEWVLDSVVDLVVEFVTGHATDAVLDELEKED